MRGVFLFPVAAGGRTLGVMAFSSRHVREPDQRMLAMVRSIGGQVGQSLQRIEAQAVLRESEDRYRNLTDLAADWYWELDADARFTFISRRSDAERDRAGLTGRQPWELGYDNFDADKWTRFRAEFAARRPIRDIEASWIDRDGDQRTILVSGYPVHDARGAFIGYRGISRDVTERRREARLHALEHEVAHALTETGELLQAVGRVMSAVCEVSGFDCARFFMLDDATGTMRQAGGWSADPGLLDRFVTRAAKRDFKRGEGVVGEVWRSGRAVWVEDIARDPRFVNAAAAGVASLRTGFTVPIAYGGRIEGVLTFLSTRLRAEDELVLNTARAVASQLAQYLARSRSQEQLRENEERFRNLTELSSDWYWEQDAELRFVNFAGGNIPSKWGVDQLNAVGKRRWEIPGVEAVSCSWEEHQAELAARRPYRNFIYMREHRETGQPHYVSASGYPVFDAEGRFAGYRGVATDVTERKREELLRTLEHRVSGVLAVGEDAGDALVEVVRAACESLGIDSGRYFQADEAGGALRFVGGWGIAEAGIQRFLEASRQIRYRLGEGIAGAVWQSGEPIWIADVRQDPRASASVMATTTEMRFLLVVPVVADGRVHGTLSFASRRMTVPDERLLKALVAVGSQLGQFLGRARSQADLRRSNARLALHARRQERIADFGQLALRRQGAEELIEGALQALGADAPWAVFFERDAGGRLLLRQGHGPEVADSVGRTGPLIAGAAAERVLLGGQTERVDAAYLAALPADMPWSGWIRRMQSGLFVPVTHNGHAHGMLALFSDAPGAYEDDDVRFAESVGHVLSAALQREQAEQRLSHMAQFDALTGLPNRSLLEDRLRQTMAQSRRKHWQTGVLFVDLDRFKLVNDTLGHPVGDRVLREVALRLGQCVRADDTVGRISGDEFAVVLADLKRPEDAGVVAQKILEALARPFALEQSETFVSASIGISLYPTDGEDADTLLRNADMAMYRAKKASRNAYRFFTAKMNDRTVRKLQLHTDLRHAVERREFTLHYQPKVELAGGTLTGMEALLRWTHPQRGAVSPAEFIPALEESGLIIPVGDWVIEEACAQLKRWRDAGFAPAPVAINLSPKQFRKRDLDGDIQRALAAAGLPASLLELEVTESSIADDPEDAVRILGNLRAAGMTVSVDDFGTGYSSLAYLTRLPISALKIDRSFVRDAETSPEAVSIVRAVIDMAHNLRFTVVAEGVETDWQAKFLRLNNCDQAQGYLFGRPMPAAEMEGRLGKAGA
jgi:diguanylate cyclase (GGDEF)-like protein/PAS domain S-box-containing protein